MAKFLIDLYLDGYESNEDMVEACEKFISEQLNMTASGITIEDPEEVFGKMKQDLSSYEGTDAVEYEKMLGYNAAIDDIIKYFKNKEE